MSPSKAQKKTALRKEIEQTFHTIHVQVHATEFFLICTNFQKI